MQTGRVAELWRYPIKSMRGERIARTAVEKIYGFPGDRGWAIRDDEIGEIRGAKQIRELVQLAARYLEEPKGASTPTVEIDLGDGQRVRSDAAGINATLEKRLGRPVSLWARQPADNLDHYRRVEALDEPRIRSMMALLPDEAIPDYGPHIPPDLTEQLAEFVAPPGTYFDGFELHLISTTSLETLSSLMPESTIDVRRFRPNIVIDSNQTNGYPELEWVGRHLRIGSMMAKVVMPMVRCVMVTLPQDDLPRDPKIMRTLVREANMSMGAALAVIEAGHVAEGDSVELAD